jgi:4-aminobutyrate aminotransferase-like enzyme
MGLTGKVAPYKAGFGPFPAEIYHAKYPNALHGVSEADALASIESIFKYDVEAERVAAIIIEPVQGEGGFYASRRRSRRRCARCATSTASSSSPTRCRPAPAAPAPGWRASNGASRPT